MNESGMYKLCRITTIDDLIPKKFSASFYSQKGLMKFTLVHVPPSHYYILLNTQGNCSYI